MRARTAGVRTRAKSAVPSPDGGNGWAWGKVRERVRRRDVNCIWRDETCAGRLEVDHILSRYEGGDDSMANLRLLCRSHHVRRHNSGAELARRRPRVGIFGRTA